MSDLLLFVQATSLSTNTAHEIFELQHIWSDHKSLKEHFCVLKSHQSSRTSGHATNRNCMAEYLCRMKNGFVCFVFLVAVVVCFGSFLRIVFACLFVLLLLWLVFFVCFVNCHRNMLTSLKAHLRQKTSNTTCLPSWIQIPT